MPTVDKLGMCIGRYGPSRSFRGVGWALAFLFAAVAAFLLFLVGQISAGKMRFDGPVSLLSETAFAALGIAVVVLLLFEALLRSRPVFTLYEHGIVARGKKLDRTDAFEDIEDLFLADVRWLAYRGPRAASWVSVDGRTSRIAELRERFRALLVQHRVPMLKARVLAGQAVTFAKLPDRVALAKSWTDPTHDLDVPTEEVIVTRERIQIAGKVFAIDRIADLKTSAWTERCTLVDVDGKVLHAMHSAALLSADVLHALLVELQARPG